MTIRVVLVDDQEMIRAGLRMMLDSRPEISVVGEAGGGEEAIALLDAVDADVVVMDVRMPRLDGVAATRRIRAADDAPAVLVLTTFDLDEYAYDALRAGAGGFLLKDAPLEEIAQAIGHVHAGEAIVAPSTTRRLLDQVIGARGSAGDGTAPRVPDPRLERLTAREREVLLEVARGHSNAEIAERLVLAEGTVKIHVGRILTKLGLRDRVQAVVLAHESGLMHRGDADPES
ncbi:response regulator [Brevibacterium ihuae]|uniref:response regulator n=1 Tax=Brevibacterium ihuae TaxID=1631743 RepID=UPI000C77A459|nr:response regulator transcription factor [Brevibacterium ihuae]